MKIVILYQYPESALCIRCKNGEIHTQQAEDALSDFGEYEAICFLNSENNDGTSCPDFKLDETKKEMYSAIDDFEGYFEVEEQEED